ncbi:MAG: Hsp20/alpha crystallin family protein [Patescibacteria group bacterium]|nr:Hsp20/alpha crystallin family protein [Patescibacteria group bacterium]
MTKQKKSFLDKIISSGEKEEKENNKTVDFEDDKENEKALSEIEAIKKIESEDEEGIEKEEKIFPENKKRSEDNKEISDGEEGQLTIDVYQSGSFIIVKSIIGGARSEDLDISITSDMVTIRGARKNPDEVKAENYYYQECFWGNFSRSVILPCDIKTDEVKATIKNGILTIKLPKIEKNSSMKIKVEEE